jgi:hypothetical protein
MRTQRVVTFRPAMSWARDAISVEQARVTHALTAAARKSLLSHARQQVDYYV